MYVNLGPADYVEVSVSGETYRYGPGAAKVQREDTATRDNGARYRYLNIVIPLADGEFPETTGHIRAG